MSIRHLDRLLSPTSVAVFGASERDGSVGATVWRNLRAGRFAGPIHAVNPKHAQLDGVPVFARASQLPGPPDLAVLCTPARTVAPLVAELGALGTRAAIVLGGGLDARQTQAALDAARPHLMRLLGPESIGLLSPHIGLNASLAHTDALPGELAFVSQSGALATAVLDWANGRGIGLSHLVSLGGHCDVDFGDLLDHLANDARTRSILLYIESVQSPRKFMSAARAAARNKPVIVIKAGRTDGADLVYDAAIRRAGMLRVDTLQDLFVAAETLARFRGNRSDRLTILASGGAGVMAADAAARAGVVLAEPSHALRERLKAVLPGGRPHANPIDIASDAPAGRHAAALSALLADESAGAVLFVHAPTAFARSDDIARACLPFLRKTSQRVMSAWLGDAAVARARQLFEQAGVPDYATPEEAVRAFAMLQTYRRNQEILTQAPSASENPVPDVGAARRQLDAALADGRAWLGEQETRAVLAAYGVPMAAAQPGARPPHVQELFVEAGIDSVFGPVIRCGQGGGAMEAMADSAAGLPPLNRSLAGELVSRTRVSRLLAGFGDRPPARVDALYDVLIAVSQMLADLPQLAELRIDPLWVDEAGVLALGARIRVGSRPAAGAERFAIPPYPSAWVRTQAWSGRTITVRPIRPEDEAQHRRFIAQLDPEDMRMRMFQTRRELPHSELARLTQIDYDREMAFIAEAVDAQGVPETLGVARTVSDPDHVEAEFAIVVRSDLKGSGLGTLLFDRLIEHARSRGIGRLVGLVLRENARMLKLARAMGFEVDAAQPDAADVRRVVKVLDAKAGGR